MVGPPKTLQDLRRIEAAVRVTCRACGRVHLLDREELIAQRMNERRSCEWPIVRADLSCRACHEPNVRVDGVPFAENAVELRQRRSTMLMINLSLVVLDQAARQSARERPAEEAVRLALRVLHPHVADNAMLTEFWRQAMDRKEMVYCHPQLVIRWIVGRLVARGYAVWAELR